MSTAHGHERRWVPDGEGLRCKGHDFWFAKGEACPDCEPSPLVEISDVMPEGVVTTDQHEAWYLERSEVWQTQADKVLNGEISLNENADVTTIAAKAEDVARKHRAESVALAKGRERKQYILKLRKEREKIRGGWGVKN